MFIRFHVLIFIDLLHNVRSRRQRTLCNSNRARQLHFSGHKVPKESVACSLNSYRLIGQKSNRLEVPVTREIGLEQPWSKKIL